MKPSRARPSATSATSAGSVRGAGGAARLLETMTEALSTAEPVDAVLRRCVEAVVAHLGVILARVWLRPQGTRELVLRASAGLYTHTDGAHARIQFGQFKIGRIAASGQPYSVNGLVGDREVHDQQWVQRERLAAFAGIPMVVEDEVVGVFAVFSREALDDDTLRILSVVARSIAVGMQRREAREWLERSTRVLAMRQTLSQRMLAANSRANVVAYSVLWLAGALGAHWTGCVELDVRRRRASVFGAYPRGRVGVTATLSKDDINALRSGEPRTLRAADPGAKWAIELAGRAGKKAGEWLLMPVSKFGPRVVCVVGGDALPPDAPELVRDASGTSQLAYERAQLLEGLEEGQLALRKLSRKLIAAREEERKSIARELHDEMGQTLTALKLSVEALGSSTGSDNAALRETSLRLVSDVLQRIRGMNLELRPPMLEDFGLHVALATLVERLERQGSLRVAYRQRGLAGARVGADLENAAYRVVQEALTNVARHSGVREADVSARRTATSLEVTVSDNGKGLTAEAFGRGAGLLGMRERVAELGGALSVSTGNGRGCRVKARFPLGREL